MMESSYQLQEEPQGQSKQKALRNQPSNNQYYQRGVNDAAKFDNFMSSNSNNVTAERFNLQSSSMLN